MSNAILQPFGELPIDWKYGLVEENVNYLTGPAFDSDKFNTEGRGVRLVRGINLTKGATRWQSEKTKYWDSDLEKLIKYELIENDILIGMDGSLVGKNYAYLRSVDLPALLVQRVARLRVKEYFSSRFLYFLFGTDEWLTYVETVKTSSGIPHISNGDIKAFHIPTPPLPDQQKIAKILTSVDEVIETTQAQIDKLKDLKTGMMQELLTNGIGHTEFKDSPVGRIPADWEVKKFGDITLEHKQGYYSKDKYTLNGTYLIRITDMQSPFISFAEMPKMLISEKDKKAYKVLNGDFLFARSGAIGRYGIFDSNNEATFASYLIRFRFDLEKILNEFVGFWYESDVCQKQLGTITQGSSNININAQNIKELRIPIPVLNEQKKITQTILSIVKKINCAKLKLNSLKNQKKALMQDLLTGKVRVKVDSE